MQMRRWRRELCVLRLPDAAVLLRARPWDFLLWKLSDVSNWGGQTPFIRGRFISDWRRSVSEPDLWRKLCRCRIPALHEPCSDVQRETPPPTWKAFRCLLLSMTALLHRKP